MPGQKARHRTISRILYRRKTLLAWLIASFCVAAVLFVSAWFVFRPGKALAPVSYVRVLKGQSAYDVAVRLKQSGLVRSARVFRAYLLVTGQSRSIRAGQYAIRLGLDMRQIASLITGPGAAREGVMVTIPEGFTANQVGARLEQSGVCSAKAFLQAANSPALKVSFLPSEQSSLPVKVRLEGYLFPDTYSFLKHEDPALVVDTMLGNFERHLTQRILANLARQHESLPTLITKASMIEKEAKVGRERPLIASVIENRLRRHMPLQIDATIQYIVGHTDVVTRRDTRIKDAYNTYLHDGLPPGPISNPGIASILAALHPAQTPYLYYVVKNDGSGEDYFSTTYEEQLRNEEKSQQSLKSLS